MPQTTFKSLSSLPNQSKRPRATTDVNASAIISIILQESYNVKALDFTKEHLFGGKIEIKRNF
jgi:hypothetical protein